MKWASDFVARVYIFPSLVALGKEVIEAWISCFQLWPRTRGFMAASGTDSFNDSWIHSILLFECLVRVQIVCLPWKRIYTLRKKIDMLLKICKNSSTFPSGNKMSKMMSYLNIKSKAETTDSVSKLKILVLNNFLDEYTAPTFCGQAHGLSEEHCHLTARRFRVWSPSWMA